MYTPGDLKQALIEISHQQLLDLVLKVASDRAEKQRYFDSLSDALSWEMCGYGEAIALLWTFSDDERDAIAKLQNRNDSRFPELIANFSLKLDEEANYLRVRQAI